MKHLHLLGTVLLVACTIISYELSAKIYTWTDEKGKVHFSDKPIDNENVTTIKPKVNGNITKTVVQNNQWQEDYNKTKQAKAEKAQKIAKKKTENTAKCNSLKSELAIYQQGGRLYVMSPSGERNYQSEEQLSAKKKKLAKQIKRDCR
jgi:hypothetical protein